VDPADALRAHVRRFNDAVGTGDFGEMMDGFTEDAEMIFEGVPAGPYVGREAIAEAYARQPPTDEVRLLGEPAVGGDRVESGYAWAADGTRAGRMILTVRDELISRLVVTFE
jgi:hypothetical protein